MLIRHHKRKAKDVLQKRADSKPDAADEEATQEQKQTPTTLADQPASPKTPESSPRHVSHHRTPQRELTSSIASNLASARGIPQNRQRRSNQTTTALASQTAEGQVSSPRSPGFSSTRPPPISETAEATHGIPPSLIPTHSKPSKPETVPASPSATSQPQNSLAPADDAFSRFYSSFEGLLTKLSAPLAFAGLPLNSESSPEKSSEKQQPVAASRVSVDPDVTKIFSRAALHAVREENGFGGPAESFYVVPPTGLTRSYAATLGNHRRQESNLSQGDGDEDWHDASEIPTISQSQSGTASPNRARKSQKLSNGKSAEEILQENICLKATVDDLAKRLRTFEMSAQKNSIMLAEQFRKVQSQSQSPVASMIGGGGSGGNDQARTRELEDEVRTAKKEVRRIGKENARLTQVVERYRERWEALKEGAKGRMKDGETADGG